MGQVGSFDNRRVGRKKVFVRPLLNLAQESVGCTKDQLGVVFEDASPSQMTGQVDKASILGTNVVGGIGE